MDGLRRTLHRYVPAHLRDPFGLAGRMMASGRPEARFAIWTAVLGAAALPLDLLLRGRERRMYEVALPPERPIIFVAGAPRSGTTIASQMLIRHLPVAYLNNLTNVFPRSPLAANQLFGLEPRNDRVGTTSYYARTRGLGGPSDALPIWDRWLDAYFYDMSDGLEKGAAEDMRRFFGALEALFDRPVLNKTNLLNVAAGLVAEVLPTATFICMVRDPLFHAQSLLMARREVHGDSSITYGIGAPEGWADEADGPIQDVCRQVAYHNSVAREQQSRIGADRFWVVAYEELCRDPAALVRRVGDDILGWKVPDHSVPEPFEPSRSRRLPPAEFGAIERELARIFAASPPPPPLPSPEHGPGRRA